MQRFLKSSLLSLAIFAGWGTTAPAQHCSPPPEAPHQSVTQTYHHVVYVVYYRRCHQSRWQCAGHYNCPHAAAAKAGYLRECGYYACVKPTRR